MKNNEFRVLIQTHQDGELTGGVSQIWNNDLLSEFLLNLEGDVSINRPEKNFIKILINDKSFEETFANINKK